jgi:tellurite resistance protein
MFFGAGVLAWLAVESVILHRLLTAEELKLPLRPTLGIQLAPPCVALLAYASITTGPPDLLARMLLGYALFQALLLLRLMLWIRQPFTAGYWGFSFGVTAIAAGVMRFAQRGDDRIFLFLAPILFAIANFVVVGLFAASVAAALRGTLLPKLPLPTSPPALPR